MLSLILSLAAAAQPASRPINPLLGTWLNPRGTVAVGMQRCGTNLCGRVTWASPEAREAAAAGGTPRLIGTTLLRNFRPVEPGLWQGEVFVPDIGQTAEAEMMLIGPGKLEVNGCQFGGLLCKRQVWRRAPGKR